MIRFIKLSHRTPKHTYNWYHCSYCNREFVTRHRNPQTESCGCMAGNHKHGHERNRTTTPELRTYRKMMERCNNEKCPDFPNWGGRGITVCERWKGNFENFLLDMGLRPSAKHSIDRIDNNKGYSPENCRWATQQEQCRNTRKNVHITFNGDTKTLVEWLQKFDIPTTCYYRWSHRGVPFAEIVDRFARRKTE